jgi:inositol transport system ATP-binding protein
VTILRDGYYVDTRPIQGVERDELIRMMVGRTISNLFPKQDVPAGETVLKDKNLTRSGVFRNISFELRKGEILGMAGLVGAGRTDVARALFGVEPATSGSIEIEDREVKITSPEQAIRMGSPTCPKTARLTA